MKRLLAGVLAAATIGAGAFAVGSATGQGTGGTLGAGAVGTKSFTVRIKENQFGANCGNLPQRRCFAVPPRLASIGAGNGQVFDGGNRTGTALFANITARRSVAGNRMTFSWRRSSSTIGWTRSRSSERRDRKNP